jgi:hypothetical protein
MVRYYSDDGVFDANLQKVWQLIQAHGDPNNKIHGSLVSAKGAPRPDGSWGAEWVTRGPDGKNVNHKLIITAKPPFAQSVEFTDGPFKGSWMTTTYLPEGNRTRCVTVAEWKVQGVTDPAATLKVASDFFDNGFEEDSRFLKTMK